MYDVSMKRRQKWLITGGAGYLGAHIADLLLSRGIEIVILDSLNSGLPSRIEYLSQKYKVEIPFIKADIRDHDEFRYTLEKHEPQGIMHTAALKAVGESIQKPDLYLEVNLHATIGILDTIKAFGIQNFIFSSTAAVYGSPNHSVPVREDDETIPISPYGISKLEAEAEVSKFLAEPGNCGTSLRFFNIVGTASPELTDNSTENLVPIVINMLKKNQPPIIYGTDYPTTDGTCVRDYVDVRDVARAHLLAANSEIPLPFVLNVGTGAGRSVREVIDLVSAASGHKNVAIKEGARREGDSASLCADASKIREVLDFECDFTLEESIKSLFRN
jgi:UDP-glucose 4-epimerase